MAQMGRYCKAYGVARFQEFAGWRPNEDAVRRDTREVDGKEIEVPVPLTIDRHLYLHESMVVTDGIFFDENIIFSDVTPEWESFCRNILGFCMPPDLAESVPTNGPRQE